MKKTCLALAFATATLFACNSGTSGGNGGDSTTANNDTTGTMSSPGTGADSGTGSTAAANAKPVSDMDKQFMMDAGAGGNTEVMASNIALTMSKNQRVKDFANMMIKDHGMAGNELKTLAGQKNVMLPDSVMPKQHDELDMLRKTPAKNFDQAYIKMMDKDHKETIDKFQMASQKCDDSDVKTWAAKTLPTLKMHADSVMALQKAVK